MIRQPLTLIVATFGLWACTDSSKSEPPVEVLQPVDEGTADSPSDTDQDTETSPVYQPLLPSVPVTVGAIAGGVESVGGTSHSATFRVPCTMGMFAMTVPVTVSIVLKP